MSRPNLLGIDIPALKSNPLYAPLLAGVGKTTDRERDERFDQLAAGDDPRQATIDLWPKS